MPIVRLTTAEIESQQLVNIHKNIVHSTICWDLDETTDCNFPTLRFRLGMVAENLLHLVELDLDFCFLSLISRLLNPGFRRLCLASNR